MIELLTYLCVVVGLGADGPTAWRSQVLFTTPAKLSGAAIADLDPTTPGNEIAVVAENGAVFVVSRAPSDGSAITADAWIGREVYRAPGEVVQVAVGDVDPDAPGLEIVATGKAIGAEHDPGGGAAYVVRRNENSPSGWEGLAITTTPQLLHAVCVIERDAIVAGSDATVWRIRKRGGGDDRWESVTLGSLPAKAKTCVPFDGGLVVSCTDGSLVHVHGAGESYQLRVLDKRDVARSRIGVDGNRVLCSDDDGRLTLFEPSGASVLVPGSGAKQRGAVIADLDPEREGLEFATAGYDRRVRILWRDPSGIHEVVPFVDDERIHHTVAGNLDADAADELVCVSFSGHVVMVEAISAPR